MKNLLTYLSLATIISFALVSCAGEKSETNARESAAAAAVNSQTSVSESDIVWTAYKITGDSHTGTLQLKSSSLEFEGDKLSGGSFEVDMNTLENTDLEGEWHDKLVGHLKSDDFFGIEVYPISRFVITEVAQTDGGKYQITGDMTIKDSTHSVQTIAETEVVGNELMISTNFNVDRTKFDVKYGSSSFFEGLGDKAIKDEFNLDIKIKSPLQDKTAASLN